MVSLERREKEYNETIQQYLKSLKTLMIQKSFSTMSNLILPKENYYLVHFQGDGMGRQGAGGGGGGSMLGTKIRTSLFKLNSFRGILKHTKLVNQTSGQELLSEK